MNTKLIKLNSKVTKKMSFDDIYYHFKNYVYKIAFNYTNSKCEADDFAQIGFIKMYEVYNKYDINKNITFKTFFTKCLNNSMRDYYKQIHKDDKVYSLERYIDSEGDNSLLIDNMSSNCEIKSLVESVLTNYQSKNANNTNRDKKIIEDILNGISQTEIAKSLGLVRATVSCIFKSFCKEFNYQYNISVN